MLLRQLLLICCVCATLAQKYHTLNDDYDEDAVNKVPGLLKQQFDCFLDRRPCNPVQQSYKKYIADAFQSSCDKCLPHQEHEFHKFRAEGKRTLPEEYQLFRAKFDPKGIYFPKLEVELDKY